MTNESTQRAVLSRVLEHALHHLETLEERPVNASISPDELRGRLNRRLTSTSEADAERCACNDEVHSPSVRVGVCGRLGTPGLGGAD